MQANRKTREGPAHPDRDATGQGSVIEEICSELPNN